jgi:hypothetical protein
MPNKFEPSAGVFRQIRQKASAWLKRFRPTVEEKLVARAYCERTSKPSVALFTLHKAGSTFLSERLAAILREEKLQVADFGHYTLRNGIDSTDPLQQESLARYIFSRKGVFHKAVRFAVSPEWLGDTRVLLVTRDPRDIITSMYFSLKYSHVLLNEEMMEQRKRLEKTTVDQFVLESAGFFNTLVKTLEDYRAFLNRPNVLHESYEHIVTQPVISEARIASFLGLPDGRKKIFSPADFSTSGEDVGKHKRQVLPGDHARKLAPETIRYCNEKIRHMAPLYGWTGVV